MGYISVGVFVASVANVIELSEERGKREGQK